MSYAQTTLPEFEHEMATTRKLLERVPEQPVDELLRRRERDQIRCGKEPRRSPIR